ncbi:MAG: Spy/CpxP family protein refolding chaperone [Acidobacteriota bacterium]
MTRSSTLTLLLASALAFPVLAQPPQGGPHGDGHHAAGRLDFLSGYLALSDSQKQQAQTFFSAAEAARESTRGQIEAAREALQTAVKSNAPNPVIDQRAASIAALEGQALALSATAQRDFYQILTPEQRTKLDTLQARRGPRGHRP